MHFRSLAVHLALCGVIDSERAKGFGGKLAYRGPIKALALVAREGGDSSHLSIEKVGGAHVLARRFSIRPTDRIAQRPTQKLF